MGNELKPDVKKKEKVLFRIRHFSGNYGVGYTTFDIAGPALSRKCFATVHKYLDDAMSALNTGLTLGNDSPPKLDPPKPGAVENAE